jgi:4'-phosphopantetheinyl transferase
VERCAATRSADEHARAARFRFPQDRDRFVAARGLLRAILGGYLDLAPETLRFRYGRRGKPSLSPAGAGVELRFNVSHAGDLALVAVTRSREVGIDIERIRADIDLDLLIEASCSPAEIVALNACRPQDRVAAFFTYWTLKEAYLKGVGDGLHCPPDRLTVHPQDDGRPSRLLVGGSRVEDWTVRSFAVAPGFVGAVAVEGDDFALSRRCWS